MSSHSEMIGLIKAISGQANVIAIPRVFVSLTGDMESAAFLSQCVYWSDKTSNPNGFYKNESEWESEIGVKRRKLERIMRVTSKWVSYENHLANGQHTRHFKVNLEQLAADIVALLAPETYKTSVSVPYKTSVSITETTQETTTTLSTKTVESQTGGTSRKQKRQQTSIDGETVTEPEVGSSPPPISALPPPPTEPAVNVTRDQVEDLLIEFCSETGIPMPEWEQKGKGAENQRRWLTPLRSLLKLCKADGKMASQLVKDAVKKMREDELTIASPQSIENVAIAIYGVKHGAKKRRTIGW